MALGVKCDSPVPNWAGSGSVVSKLSEVVSDVCFYTCFVGILWELSINKYENLYSGLQSMVASFVGLGRYLLEQGIEIGGAGTSILESLLDSLEGLASGSLNLVGMQFDSFPSALWAFIKGEVLRYFEPLMLASIQSMMSELSEELNNRRRLLGEVEQKIDDVKTAMNNLMGFDWWEDWIVNVVWAAQHVRSADREIQRVYSDINVGEWDGNHLDMSENHMLVAWKLLSSDDEFNAFMTEIGEQIGQAFGEPSESQQYKPFDWSFKANLFNEFLDDLKTLGERLNELKDLYDCLVRTSGRATILKALIFAAAEVLAAMAAGTGPLKGIYLDVALQDNVLDEVHENLIRIYNEMTDIVENERRTVAPIYNMQWRNDLKSMITLLSAFGALPTPLGLDFTQTVASANNQLQYILYQHDPKDGVKSLSEYDFSDSLVGRRLQEFVLTAGNLADLLTQHSQWEQKITQLKTSIRNMKQRDATAKTLCDTFENYDDERYTYLVSLLDDAGWTAAHKYLTCGKLHELLQLSVSGLGIISTAVQCLSKTIATMVEDKGLQIKLNDILTSAMAEDRVATRTSVALPSFQFKAFNTIQMRLGALETDMQDILNLQNEVC